MFYSLLRSALFRLDAEFVHDTALGVLSLGECLPDVSTPLRRPDLQQELFGLNFPNPVGLAAGFDKNARLPHVWHQFGFGFAELGTVTAKPQPGNPKQRIFRIPQAGALINRLGFNNDGAKVVAARLASALRGAPAPIPIGINIGKSAATALDDAVADYRFSYELLAPLADYVAINVSSPNTPGLRSLQAAESLAEICDAIRATQVSRDRRPPLLVKLAPDLEDAELAAIVDVARSRRIDGLIATNTTIERGGLPATATHRDERGGLSGKPLRARSTEVIRTLYCMSDGRIPIIGVGGIFDAEDAAEKILAGASLVQMYTGFIYGGPQAPRAVVDRLGSALEAAGCSTIRDAVGARCG